MQKLRSEAQHLPARFKPTKQDTVVRSYTHMLDAIIPLTLSRCKQSSVTLFAVGREIGGFVSVVVRLLLLLIITPRETLVSVPAIIPSSSASFYAAFDTRPIDLKPSEALFHVSVTAI